MSAFENGNNDDNDNDKVKMNCRKTTKIWKAKEIVTQQESINRWSPRGGSSITTVQENVVIFGGNLGADRNQTHFNDLIICRQTEVGQFVCEKIETTGDVPTPRSGHAVAAYGRFMFLFGGIDFSEEIVYNDLYILNIETLEWKYVGESGAEIPKRNSHSLMIISEGEIDDFYLVLYGGASPDEGVFGDCYYAVLPKIEKIGSDDFYVNWIKFEDYNGPGSREMHSCCRNQDGSAVIIGGRNEDGTFRSDVWTLRVNTSSSKTDKSLLWERLTDLEIPFGRCAHGASIVDSNLCIYGGFTSEGIAADLTAARIIETADETAGEIGGRMQKWETIGNCSIGESGRFGMGICTAPCLSHTLKEGNLLSGSGFILFGGVCAENDFGDIWYIHQT